MSFNLIGFDCAAVDDIEDNHILISLIGGGQKTSSLVAEYFPFYLFHFQEY